MGVFSSTLDDVLDKRNIVVFSNFLLLLLLLMYFYLQPNVIKYYFYTQKWVIFVAKIIYEGPNIMTNLIVEININQLISKKVIKLSNIIHAPCIFLELNITDKYLHEPFLSYCCSQTTFIKIFLYTYSWIVSDFW